MFSNRQGTASRTVRSKHPSPCLAVAAIAFLSAGLATAAPQPVAADAERTPAARTSAGRLGPDFSDLVKQVVPAVVNISTSGTVKHPAGMSPSPAPGPDLPDNEFFRRFFGPGPGGEAPPAQKLRAQGSGVIVDPNGLVVTNHHVVEHADEITVTLSDGSRYPATLRGRDGKTDLALLEIEAPNALPYAHFGDSDSAEVGDWVIAVGNPFGLGGSVSAGIISARGRDIHAGPYDDFIQTDAPINQGNSGGPLFNTAGEIIGINTAIFSPTGGNVGIGFAIPSILVAEVVADLESHGRVARGWLGVSIQPVTEEIAANLDLVPARGALVATVAPGSPAARAGVEPGDVILRFGETDIETLRDLTLAVARTPAETRVEARVWRDGSLRPLRVAVGSAPEPERVASATQPAAEVTLGVQLADLTPEIRNRYQLAEESTGVLVVGVAPESPAAEQGIRPGDLIVRVGSESVGRADEVAERVRAAADAERETVLLLIARGEAARYVAVPLEHA